MSDEVETMMYAGDTPWHGFGVYVGEEPLTSEEAIVKAGLDWKVVKQQLFTSPDGLNVVEVETHKAVIRTSDGAQLGIVGNRYEPIQNSEAFQFLDSLVGNGKMRYETAGSLRGGQRVWLLGKTDEFDVLPGDTVGNYIFLYNSHDGSRALRVLFTNIRVVCMNTARMALEEGDKEGLRVLHTSNVKEHIRKAESILEVSRTVFNNFIEFSKMATNKHITESDMRDIVDQIIPQPPKDIEASKRLRTVREITANKIVELYHNGTGQDINGVAGTGWAAYNAVVEFFNYYKKARNVRQQERRFESSLLGDSFNLINKAMIAINKA
jgi:phage/plasmid-like protein (TIGR03299 family)